MKRMLWVWLVCALALPSMGVEKASMLKLEDKLISGIEDVHLAADGRVIILYENTGITVAADKLPPWFLESWNITPASIQEAQAKYRSQQEKKTQEDLQRAINRGLFRQIEGIIYDLRKPQPGWVQLSNARILHVIPEGAFADVSPNPYSIEAIFVKNVPASTGDANVLNCYVKQVESLRYLNRAGERKTIRTFDFGTACKRNDIPEPLLAGKVASIRKPDYQAELHDPLKGIPDKDNLKSCGSGFFITEDGFLVTNDHVVKDAKTVRIKIKSGVLNATVIKTDSTRDLALLKVTGKFEPLSLAEGAELQLGETTFTIGFPNPDIQGVEPKYTDGKISSLKGLQDDSAQYQISVPVQPGNSGGALVDLRGEVVGVVVARLNDMTMLRSIGSIPQNVNYAIKAHVLREFIKQVPGVTLPSARSIKPDEVIKNAQSAAAMVLIY